MKTYFGIPGDPAVVMVADMAGTRRLDGDFAWGPREPRGGALALAILDEHLGDPIEARRIYRRFLWRVIAGWAAGQPWTLTSGEIDTTLEAIRDTEGDKAIAAQRARIATERPPIVDDRVRQDSGEVSIPRIKG